VATGQGGEKLADQELTVLLSLPKRATGQAANVTVRGVGGGALELRPQVRLAAGRMLRPGAAEVVVGNKIAERFQNAGLGERLRFGLRDWRVVGVLDAGNTGFGSEVWGDADLIMQAVRRPVYSAVILRLRSPADLAPLKARLEADPRLTVDVFRETEFYAKQSRMMSRFITILGTVLTVIFSFGATIGAMITMYAAVANRTREIGTLRALGYARRSIMLAFLAESLLLAAMGAGAGLLVASTMQFLTVSTTNWQTFSELAFRLTLTPRIVAESLLFALGMGLAGGVLPALRASRLNIVEALRAA
jgi:putative ABC transport system permease protein